MEDQLWVFVRGSESWNQPRSQEQNQNLQPADAVLTFSDIDIMGTTNHVTVLVVILDQHGPKGHEGMEQNSAETS